MAEGYKSYRIRTNVGQDAPNVINVHLDQTYDSFEILSLTIDQKNSYNLYQSDTGVVAGRVIANGGFGIPNAKVSIFIPTDETIGMEKFIMYPYRSVTDVNNDRVRYNLLPDYVDNICHQNVGTFPNKRYLLDNDTVIEVFDEFWKYTTVTNNAGDYFLYGIPTGSQTVHVDVDLSDIGLLSQTPRDLTYKGFNSELFESPTKFKKDTNLNSLAQIKSQDIGVYVYPFWGDSTDDGGEDIAITRCDIQIDYKFEPTCVFIGSVVTDSGTNAIGKNCAGTDSVGKMSDLTAGEGSIEMIRKTIDGKTEEFQIKGNRLIDGDGVWCYQIPMNLDYVMTDEFGNIVPTDNPDKGIATRTRVRFRISLDDAPNDNQALKRCKFLVPNNPRLDKEKYPIFFNDGAHEPDYEFGTNTLDESYCDMFWNKVYTIKSYIPRIQKNNKITNRKHTGIKMVNHYGNNNPMCVLTKVFIKLVGFLNNIITLLGMIPCQLAEFFYSLAKPFNAMRIRIRAFGRTLINICLGCPIGSLFEGIAKIFDGMTPSCIAISSEFCSGDNATHAYTFYPGCGKFIGLSFGLLRCVWDKTRKSHDQHQINGETDTEDRTTAINRSAELYNCVEAQLAEDNEATSFNFQNDWINGVLYSPTWIRKITPKKRFFFGLFSRRAKDEWCTADNPSEGLVRLFNPCAIKRNATGQTYTNFNGDKVTPIYMGKQANGQCSGKCHESTISVDLNTGFIRTAPTMLGKTVYYFKPVEYDSALKEVKLIFATDIVLLGSLNECDLNGVPQFFKSLDSSTYRLPPNMLFTDNTIEQVINADGTITNELDQVSVSEMAGCDWGNSNEDICSDPDGGLFYSIGCSTISMIPKSCINLSRICEYGVSLDETKQIPDYSDMSDTDIVYKTMVPDGFISKDELYNDDERSMFATMNGNGLKTKLNTETGLLEYDFRHLYVDNFDKSLYEVMKARQLKCRDFTYALNYQLEDFSRDYYDFRMGPRPYYYDSEGKLPRYENSFYFYFGLKGGKTAIEKFNSQFFAECYREEDAVSPVAIEVLPNTWCSDLLSPTNESQDGYVKINLSRIYLPCNILIQDKNSDSEFILDNIDDDKIVITNIREGGDETDYPGYEEGYVRKCMKILVNGEEVEKCALSNGSYRIIITDNDGEIIMDDFEMMPKYLSFKTSKTNFKVGENILNVRGVHVTNDQGVPQYDGSGNPIYSTMKKDISNNKLGLNPILNDTVITDIDTIKRNIGGIIVLYDVIDEMYGKTLPEYEVTITNSTGEYVNKFLVKGTNVIPEYIIPDSDEDNNKIYLLSYGPYVPPSDDDANILYYINDSTGEQITVYEYNQLDDSEKGNYRAVREIILPARYFVFGVPFGDETYSITVRQCCQIDGLRKITTNNVVTQSIRVMNSIPYKLFINDVIDYDVIQHWGTGFSLAEKPEPPLSTGSDDNLRIKVEYTISDGKLVDFNDNWLNISKYDEVKSMTIINPITHRPMTIDVPRYYWTELKSIDKSIKTIRRIIDDTSNAYDIHFPYVGWNDSLLDGNITDDDINSIIDGIDAYYPSVIIDNYGQPITEDNEMYDLNGDGVIDENDLNAYMDNHPLLEAKNDIIEECNSILNAKTEFVEAMKSTFWLTCKDGNTTISFRAETDEMPVAYYIAHRTEIVNDEDITENILEFDVNTNPGLIGNEPHYFFGRTNRIDEITIPSLTNIGSERFGVNDIDDEDKPNYMVDSTEYPTVSIAVDRHSGQDVDKSIRYPLFVGVVNSSDVTNLGVPNGDTIPITIKSNSTSSEPFNLSHMFGFHILDKVFDISYVAWSSVTGIPYFKTSNGNKKGKMARTAGLFAGEIYNGILTYVNEIIYYRLIEGESGLPETITVSEYEMSYDSIKEKYEPVYTETELALSESSINSFEFGISTPEEIDGVVNDEDSVPTRRFITKWKNRNQYASDEFTPIYDSFNKYMILNDADSERQYIPLLSKSNSLKLEDKFGCMISEEIYGNMAIMLEESESLNDIIQPDNSIIRLTCDNSPSDIVFIAYNFNDERNYPLNYCAKDGGFESECEVNVDDIYDRNNSYKIYSYDIDKRKLLVNGAENNKMYSTLYDSNGREVTVSEYFKMPNSDDINKRAVSTTGEFIKHNDAIRGDFFFIGLTGNNCRVISPVYSFINMAFSSGGYDPFTFTKNNCLMTIGIFRSRGVIGVETKNVERESIDENNNTVTDIVTEEYPVYGDIEEYKASFYMNNGYVGGSFPNGYGYVDGKFTVTGTPIVRDDSVANDLYYFRYFPFRLEVNGKYDDDREIHVSGNLVVNENDTIETLPKSPVLTVALDKSMMQYIYAYLGRYTYPRITLKTEIIATDYTGLRHRFCPMVDEIMDEVICITYNLNGEGTWVNTEEGPADGERYQYLRKKQTVYSRSETLHVDIPIELIHVSYRLKESSEVHPNTHMGLIGWTQQKDRTNLRQEDIVEPGTEITNPKPALWFPVWTVA